MVLISIRPEPAGEVARVKITLPERPNNALMESLIISGRAFAKFVMILILLFHVVLLLPHLAK